MSEMLEVAKKASQKAGDIILKLRGRKHRVIVKDDQSNITTEADIASEKKILGILQKEFPRHSFWSEDVGKKDNGSDYWWVIDPNRWNRTLFFGNANLWYFHWAFEKRRTYSWSS